MTVLSEMEREAISLRAFVAVAGDAVESSDIRRLLDLDAQISDARVAATAAAEQKEKSTGHSVLEAMRSVRRSPVVPTINSQTAETDTMRGVERIRRGLAGSADQA